MPRQRDAQADAYLELLDQALLDRHISRAESDGLVEVAEKFGLSRGDVIGLHARYLSGVATAALADGVVTAEERRDLDEVAALVGLPASAVDQALPAPTAPVADQWRLAR